MRDEITAAGGLTESTPETELESRWMRLRPLLDNVITDPRICRPLEYLLPEERNGAEAELRRVLSARDVSRRYDEFADRLGLAHGVPMLALSAPKVSAVRPWHGGPVDSRWVAVRVDGAVAMLLDDELNPETMLKDFVRAKSAFEKIQPNDLHAEYERARETQKRVRYEQRVAEWRARPLVARALIRLAAEDSQVHPQADLLRRIASAIEAESARNINSPLPPDDWDRKPLVKTEDLSAGPPSERAPGGSTESPVKS
jgi:hypothetical protein